MVGYVLDVRYWQRLAGSCGISKFGASLVFRAHNGVLLIAAFAVDADQFKVLWSEVIEGYPFIALVLADR